MISAARYISRKTAFGKVSRNWSAGAGTMQNSQNDLPKFGDNFLDMEKLGTIGKVATNGIDAMVCAIAIRCLSETSTNQQILT